ncbi:MAG TPA: GAF domain-containing protein, partial [Anaerolineae bacterium]
MSQALSFFRKRTPPPAPVNLPEQVDEESILTGLPGQILVLDRAGIIRWVNSGVTRSTGHPPAALIGQPLYDFIPAAERDRLQRQIDRCFASDVGAAPDLAHYQTYFQRADALLDQVDMVFGLDADRQQLIVVQHRISSQRFAADDLRARNAQLEALNAVTAIVSQSLDLGEALRAALCTTVEALRAEAGAITLVDSPAGDLVFKAQFGWRRHDFVAGEVHIKAGQGLSGQVLRSGQPLVTGAVRSDARLAVMEFGDEDVEAMALVPMRARGKAIGVLSVMNYSARSFTSDEVEVLGAIADQIGVSIENAQLHQAAQRQRRMAEA